MQSEYCLSIKYPKIDDLRKMNKINIKTHTSKIYGFKSSFGLRYTFHLADDTLHIHTHTHTHTPKHSNWMCGQRWAAIGRYIFSALPSMQYIFVCKWGSAVWWMCVLRVCVSVWSVCVFSLHSTFTDWTLLDKSIPTLCPFPSVRVCRCVRVCVCSHTHMWVWEREPTN